MNSSLRKAERSAAVAPAVADPTDVLAHTIEDLSARHGSELSATDQVILEQVLGGMAEGTDLVQGAKANSQENFMLVFGGPFDE